MKSLSHSTFYLASILILTLALTSCGSTSLSAAPKETGISPQAKAINDEAYALIKEKKPEEALPKAEEAVRLAPAFNEAQKNLALSLSMLRRYDEALAPAREAVRLKPDFDKAHNVLGKILYGLGQYRESVVEYKEAIRLNEKYALAYFNLGVSYDKLGDIKAAATAATRAVQLDPEDKYYQKWLDGILRYTAQPGKQSAALSSPKVDPANDPYAYYNYGAQIRDYLYHEQFELLDRIAHEVRTSKERVAGGVWKLRLLYQGLTLPEDGHESSEGALLYHFEKLLKWTERHPASVTARIALADTYVEHAWRARGNGTINTVSREGYKRFLSRLDQASTILRSDKKLSETCPEWYVVMLSVALGQGWDMDSYNKLFEAGIKFEPLYYTLYEEKACYLMPRWYGQPGDWERFADTMALTVGGHEGSIIYNKIVTYMARRDPRELRSGRFWKYSQISWPRTKEGYANITRLYGASAHGNNQFCLLAVLQGDRPVSVEMFKQIGENWDMDVWRHKREFEAYRNWSRT